MGTRGARFVDHLEAMVEFSVDRLENVPWVVESDRWAELVFCLLAASRPAADVSRLRDTVAMLNQLGFATFAEMAAEEPDPERQAGFRAVLRTQGFDEEEAANAVEVLHAGARAIAASHRTLTNYAATIGGRVVAELAEAFRGPMLPDDSVREALGYWVQNTTSLPFLQENQALRRLRERHGVSLDDVFDAAVAVGINPAVVEDLASATEDDPDFQEFLRKRSTNDR